MIKLLLIDAHPIVCTGIRLLLQSHQDMEVVGESYNGKDAIAMVHRIKPDVIILDLLIEDGLSGFDVIGEVRHQYSEMKIIVFSMYEEEVLIRKAVQMGINGYIVKNSKSDCLVDAIREVYSGKYAFKTPFSEDIVLKWISLGQEEGVSPITDTEKKVVRLAALGYTNKEIAEVLQISVKTVDNHKSNIMRKLNFTSKRELIHFAIKNHLYESV